MDTTENLPKSSVVVVDNKPQVRNRFKNQADFINSARRPSGIMPEVIGKKAYPANHPLANEALEKAKAKRNRKRTDRQMIKAVGYPLKYVPDYLRE